MIDTHCHLDSPRLDVDRDQVLARAWEAGLSAIVIPAVGPDSWTALLDLPQREPRLWVGLGIHPQLLPELPEVDDAKHLATLDALLAHGGAVAVGECGLDGPSAERAPLERQLRVLEGHFALARKHRLPVLLHCFHAHPALLGFLRGQPPPEAGLVLHSYSGGPELAKQYARMGCFFSFAGPVSYEGARKPLAALQEIPPDKLLVETDAPDQAPHPHRGQRSEPAYLVHIVAAIARALGERPEDVAHRTTENARRLFRR